ncbi:MAG: DNA mismatch repair endonuclease MutL [Chlorobi bacterium]|nr:DNA mismatch repair endonuclease MutL [Chlorobiota bacterium]
MPQNKIKILPDQIINKIAAGEVVQRPASVVKELMENAIDAGAENIELLVKRAGKALIQIVDDGAGMSEEDAVLSIQRHATSKIASYEDLEKIATLGFRGEALSSIASVSIFEIKTERKEDEFGVLLRKEEDSEIIIEKGSFSKGTSVSVRNLFYNVPARRNFMRSNSTELKHIIDTFNRITLSHPKISFKFWNDDDLILDYKAGVLEKRIQSVIADNITDAVVSVNEETEYFSVKGFIAKPTFLKKSKGEQYLYINKRYVKSKSINHAVFSAYEHLLQRGDYPFFILYITLDPKHVDVNVHPQKLEVKFDDEKGIYTFIHAVIKKSLGSFDLTPHISLESEEEKEKLKYIDFTEPVRPKSVSQTFSSRDRRKPEGSSFGEEDIDLLFGSINRELKTETNGEIRDPFADDELEVEHVPEEERKSELTQAAKSPFIVSLHNKYILAQIKSGLMIIDQHVAHERILYEKAVNSLNEEMPFSQQLLFSQTLRVDAGEYGLLKELEPHLIKLGFELKFFSDNTIVIDGVPPDVKVGNETETLLGILYEYRKNKREEKLEVKDNLAKSFSCKTAIKAGDHLSELEMRQLVDQLFATSTPYVCPHGRPIVVKIPLNEFDKRFGRT